MTTRRSIQLLLALSASLLYAVPAGAATVENSASSGPAASGFLEYVAAKGEKNRLTVTVGPTSVTFSDPKAKLKRKKGSLPGCSVKAHKAVCKVDPATHLSVKLGDEDDTVKFRGADVATGLGGTESSQVTDLGVFADDYADDEGAFTSRTSIDGGKGNDSITGTNKVDDIDPGPGKDKVDTGAGNDRIVDRQDKVADILRGGEDVDTVDVVGAKAVTIDLDLEVITAGTEMTSIDSFEKARGGAGHDTLLGTEGTDGLFGDGGSDTIDGKGGNDRLVGDLPSPFLGSEGTPAQDALAGGAGDDVLEGRENDGTQPLNDGLACGDGNDTVITHANDPNHNGCEIVATGDGLGG
jgi:Ca2+-binding RTX toxin-like protein